MKRANSLLRTLCCLVALTSFGSVAAVAGVEEFYKGKIVSLVIGYSAGGGYDAYARLLARYFGKHLPGNPTIIPQQMAGAGSLRAANYIYTVAPKDGTVFGTFSRSMGISPLVDKAEFDSRKFAWLGSVTDDNTLCVSSAASPVKDWNDFLTKPSKFGGEGAGSDPDIWTLMYKNVFGANVKLISGYPGTNDIVLAMERGEVDGVCGISWSTVKTQHPQWLTSHAINFVVQAALQKEPALPSTPLATDLVKTPEQLQILKLMLVTQAMARPFAAPPETPPDRKAALLSAFDATMSDSDFLADAKKLDFDVRPVSAAKIDALLADVYHTPKDVIDRAKKAIASESQ
jgi:tripartite-type tricarboxylate transporter receptor subunit TctC